MRKEEVYPTWTLDDERKQVETAAFARITILFSVFSAYIIGLGFLYGVAALRLNHLTVILFNALLLIFFFLMALGITRTNDKAHLSLEMIRKISNHPHTILHNIYVSEGSKRKGLKKLLYDWSNFEPYIFQNIIIWTPTIFAAVMLYQCFGITINFEALPH